MTDWKALLKQIQDGSTSVEEAENLIQSYIHSIKDGYVTMPDAYVDIAREKRTGFPEVIFGEGKTADQIIRIIENLHHHTTTLLATRIDEEKAKIVITALPNINLTYDSQAKIIYRFDRTSKHTSGYVAVLCAGTSDLPVAEEAALVAEAMGSRVERLYDVGVTGLHRLLSKLDIVRQATAIVVVAGMEGALASVVGGLVQKPVIAVPTSVGYGSSFQGLSALLTMLNSCAPGITVVNIDNGFGAGYQAGLIHKNQQGVMNG